MFKISNIQWDTDGETVNLPSELEADLEGEVTYNFDEVLSDWLSDNFGWCHNGFDYEVINESR